MTIRDRSHLSVVDPLQRAKLISEQWEAEKAVDEENARIEARFRGVPTAIVIRCWETERNEQGKPLTGFEREALRVQWYRLFGELPPETRVAVTAEQKTPEPATDTMLDIAEVARLTGLSPSTIKRKVVDGSFPHHIKISERRKGWPAGVVRTWLDERR